MNTFPKEEHLFGVKTIENLYTNGSAFLTFPFRVVYLIVENKKEEIPVRVMVGVSKKKHKKAVARNRCKRLMREAYRLNKKDLLNIVIEKNLRLHVSFQYIADEILTFDEVNLKMRKGLNRLMSIILENK